jgi:hypothetical protein
LSAIQSTISLIETITAITVSLKIDGTLTLFALLADDGSINRMGTGSVHNVEHDWYMGVIDNAAFRQLRSMIKPEWLDMPGRYERSDRVGPECELSVALRRAEGADTVIQFVYGAESLGPPMDLREFAATAVNVTGAWAREQKAIAERGAQPKPRWPSW